MKKRAARREAGNALIELAILTPALLTIMLGIVEVGRYAHFSIMVHNAARAGVQYGAQSRTTMTDLTGMQTAALADAQNISGLSATASQYCSCSDGSTCSSDSCATGHRIEYVKVVATGTFSSLFHYPGLPGALTITGTDVMRVWQYQ